MRRIALVLMALAVVGTLFAGALNLTTVTSTAQQISNRITATVNFPSAFRELARSFDEARIQVSAMVVPQPSPTPEPETGCIIRFGIIHPLTGSNTSGAAELLQGYELARDEINAAGGIHGCQVRFVMQDDADSPALARAAAAELARQSEIPILLGTFSSDGTLLIAEEAHRRGIPLLVANSTSTLITSMGYEWVFRIPVDSSETVRASFDFLTTISGTLPVPTVGIVYEDRLQAISMAINLATEAQVRGLSLVTSEEFNARTSNLTPIMARVRNANPDVLYIATGTVDTAVRLIQQTETLGWSPKLFLATIGAPTFPEFPQSGRYANYYVTTSQWAPDVHWQDQSGRTGRDFERVFRERFGVTPGYRAVQGYVAIQVAAQAVERALQTPTSNMRSSLRDILRTMRVEQTLFGSIEFDHRGQNQHTVLITQVLDGELVIVHPEEHRTRPVVAPAPSWSSR